MLWAKVEDEHLVFFVVGPDDMGGGGAVNRGLIDDGLIDALKGAGSKGIREYCITFLLDVTDVGNASSYPLLQTS